MCPCCLRILSSSDYVSTQARGMIQLPFLLTKNSVRIDLNKEEENPRSHLISERLSLGLNRELREIKSSGGPPGTLFPFLGTSVLPGKREASSKDGYEGEGL